MNAQKIAEQTTKQRVKLFNKYSRKYLRTIRRDIRLAKIQGRCHTLVRVQEPQIDSGVLKDLRKYTKDFLLTNGFYVREYQFGELYDVFDPEYYSISWGEDATTARHIDEIQEEIYLKNHFPEDE